MTTQQATRSELVKVLGLRGLSIFSGLVREEYLTDLRDWRQAARIYREMADNATIGTLLDAIRTPLLAAEFDVTPGGDSEGDKRAADWLWEALNSMDRQTWRSHVQDVFDCLIFGFAVPEVILEKRLDGYLWLKNLEPRGPETLQRWEWEDDRPVGFIQRDPVTGKQYPIPLDKCVHVVFRGRKGNPQGESILHCLFQAWLKLKYLENFEAIGIERDVGGMAVVDFPDPDKWHGPQDVSALLDIFEDAFKNLRMDENMWLLVPPGARAQSWGGGQRSYNVREAIVAKQKEILMRFFAQFLFLGMEQVGTQALVKGSQDFFSLALKSVQQELLEAWNLQLVPLLFRFNTFPGMTTNPILTWSDPGKVDISALITAYVQGVQGKLITPLRQDEEKVRAEMDLPDLPEGEGEGPREALPQAPFPMFSEGDTSSGVMVALYPDVETAKRIAISGGLAPEELHITLAFLGPVEDMTADKRDRLVRSVSETHKEKAFNGQIGGYGQFATGEYGTPLVALIDMPGLEEYRQSLVEHLKAAGLTPSEEHGFTPHMTLAYLKPGDNWPQLEGLVGTPVNCAGVTVSLGGQRIRLSDHPAGQRLRMNPDRWDAFANEYQRELVDTYDAWSRDTQRLMNRLKGEGQREAILSRTLQGRLDDLEVELMTLGRRRIFEAGQLGLGSRLAHRGATPSVQLVIATLQRRNDDFLANSLMPSIRKAFEGTIAEPDIGAFRTALTKASEPLRSRVAGYSGGAVVATFETQARAGTDENAERRANGQPPIMVRWVLDPNAEHCEDDPTRGTLGCSNLAGVYPGGWAELPTVPAGNVTCLGNCRCRLDMSEDGGRTWVRP